MNKKTLIPKCSFKPQNEIKVDSKYVLISFSIFYASDYLRHFYTSKSRNISVQRQLQFLYNMTLNIENLSNGFLPSNWYFRIYYDKSLFNFEYNNQKPWKDFFKTYKNNDRVQFVEYNCPDFLKDNQHLNFFGTLMRLYPIFEKDNNRELLIVFDADMFITKNYVNQMREFLKSKDTINAFCSKYEISFYKHENYLNNDCYLRTGMISTKAQLPIHMWDFIMQQIKIFEDNKFTDIIDRVQYRWALLMPEKPIKQYREFEYGMDEIILNYYLRKMLLLDGNTLRIVRFRPNTRAIFLLLSTYLNYNYKKDINTRPFIMSLLKRVPKAPKNLKEFVDVIKTIKSDDTYKEVYPYIKPFRDNYDEVRKLYISKTVLDYIKNVSEKDYENKDFTDYFNVMNIPNYILPRFKK